MSGGAATERLYYRDAYLDQFTARVVERGEDGLRICLDRTAFYPTSGGQLNDTGIIGSANVVDVIDEGDRVVHLVDAPVTSDEVRGMIHWPRRLDHMQQHTGQHLLSAVFEELTGARTVSVHFGESSSTLDLETESLSADSLEKASRLANEIVTANRAVSVTFEDAASATGLRKAVDRTGELRIITIADLDRSACGGTHVRATGEIGGIHIRSVERVRKTMRVEFVCGLRATQRARADFTELTAIAAALSTSIDSARGMVVAQSAHFRESEQQRRRLERDLARYRAAESYGATAAGADGVRFIADEKGASIDQLKTFAQAVIAHERVLFAGLTEDGGVVVAASEDSGHDAGSILRNTVSALGGKGGGSPRLAQGSVPAGKGAEAVRAIRAVQAPGR